MAGKASRYIDGIFNYCDRWCERCSFTGRCRNYAMSEADDDPESRDIHNAKFWDKLHSIFQQTITMLREKAEEMGADLDAVDTEAFAAAEKRKRAETENHELARSARSYADTVTRWFENNQALFQEKEDDLNAALRLALPGSDPAAAAADIEDAVEVIRWYQYQIYVKLCRALSRDEDEDENYPSDSDGSAKVALIAMDRSIGAWGRLRNHLQAQRDGILDILLHLDRLRRCAEHVFPKARRFVRPGFDAPGR